MLLLCSILSLLFTSVVLSHPDDTLKKTSEKAVLIPQVVQLSPAKTSISGDSTTVSKTHLARAMHYLSQEDFIRAFSNINDAIDLCPKCDSTLLIRAELIQAALRINSDNIERTITLLNRCDSNIRKVNIDTLTAIHYNNKGLYYKKYNTDKKIAASWFAKALEINRRIDDKPGIAENINNLVSVSNSPDQNILLLQEALTINRRLQHNNGMAKSYLNMAGQYFAKGMNAPAIKYIDSTITLAEKINNNDLIYNALKFKSRIYSKEKNFKAAFEALDTATAIKDRYLYVENIDNLERYLEEKTNKQKELQYQLDKQDLEISILNRTVILTSVSILFLILLMSAAFQYFTNKRKIATVESKKIILEQESEHNRAELTNLATFMSSRYTILEDISERIGKTLKMKEKEGIEKEMKKINLYIKSLIDKNEDSVLLNQKIDKINTEFLERLEKAHPDLTKNDKKIASFLRANLTTKQISILSNTNPASINIARYRMRQHLNLDPSVNLVDYLKKI